jgi:integrase
MPENTEKPKGIIHLADSGALAPAPTATAVIIPPIDVEKTFLSGYRNPRTVATYREALGRIRKVAGLAVDYADWGALRYEHTKAIRAALHARYKPRAVAVTLIALRGVLREAWRLGIMTREELARATDWPRPPPSRRLPAGRDLSVEEVAAIARWCGARKGPYGALVRGLFACMLGGGLRASEVAGLVLEGYQGGALRLVGKRDKERIVPLSPAARAAVEEWILARDELGVWSPFLFVRIQASDDDRGYAGNVPVSRQTLGHLCSNVARGAGIVRFGPHDLRRTYTTRLLQLGVELAFVQRLMGHERADTTALYDRRTHDAIVRAVEGIEIWPAQPTGAKT